MSKPKLTAEEEARVLSRFGSLSHKKTRLRFKTILGWVEADTPEELEIAVAEKLRKSGEKSSN